MYSNIYMALMHPEVLRSLWTVAPATTRSYSNLLRKWEQNPKSSSETAEANLNQHTCSVTLCTAKVGLSMGIRYHRYDPQAPVSIPTNTCTCFSNTWTDMFSEFMKKQILVHIFIGYFCPNWIGRDSTCCLTQEGDLWEVYTPSTVPKYMGFSRYNR